MNPLTLISPRWFLPLCILLFAGCATTKTLRVDALRDPGYLAASGENPTLYYLESDGDLADGERLRFREAASFVETALAARGYARTRDRSRAQLIVAMDASISGPISETQSFSEPLYVRRWGYTRLLRVPVRDESGRVTGFTYTRIYEPPRTEFVGWTDRTRRITVFEKSLSLSAFEARSGGERGPEQWTVRVAAVDESDDLRAYLPYLAAGAYPFVGEQTEGAVVVRMRENDENLAFIRRGL